MTKKSAPPKTTINIDQLARMFDLPSIDDLTESNQDYIWQCGSEEAKSAELELARYEPDLDPTVVEQRVEDSRYKAEQEASDEIFNKWHTGVMSAANELFDPHGLGLTPKGDSPYPWEFIVEPFKSWRDAAEHLRQTVNGYGMFVFDSLKEFLDSGPYTPKEAVLGHLHWIRHYPEVYGSDSAQRMFDRGFH